MAVIKLQEDYFEHQYTFIAIHASMEDVRLAYFLNSRLQLKLKRRSQDLMLSSLLLVPVFHWYDNVRETEWTLVKNRAIPSVHGDTVDSDGLFREGVHAVESPFLVPELPKVDFFLKADQEGAHPQASLILGKIREIKQIITAYEVDASLLKSKDNLIFLSDA